MIMVVIIAIISTKLILYTGNNGELTIYVFFYGDQQHIRLMWIFKCIFQIFSLNKISVLRE